MTVKELRDKIVDMAQGVSFSEITAFLGLLDSYGDACREDGKQSVLDDPGSYDLYSREERD